VSGDVLLVIVGAYTDIYIGHTAVVRAAQRRSFPVVQRRIPDSSQVKRGSVVGGNAPICSARSAAKWRACRSEQR